MKPELKALKLEEAKIRKTLTAVEREVARLRDELDKVEQKQLELVAGCKRGDIVRYTSGKFFLSSNQYCAVGDHLEVVALCTLRGGCVHYYLRLVESPIVYPQKDSNSEVTYEGTPAVFWRHFTLVKSKAR